MSIKANSTYEYFNTSPKQSLASLQYINVLRCVNPCKQIVCMCVCACVFVCLCEYMQESNLLLILFMIEKYKESPFKYRSRRSNMDSWSSFSERIKFKRNTTWEIPNISYGQLSFSSGASHSLYRSPCKGHCKYNIMRIRMIHLFIIIICRSITEFTIPVLFFCPVRCPDMTELEDISLWC